MNKLCFAESYRRYSDAERCAAPQFAVAFWMVASCIYFSGCIQRVPVPQRFQIASGSMAPRYYGPHFVANCQACAQSQAIATEAFDENLPTRCFACGSTCKVEHTPKAGDVVELHAIDDHNSLQRFDVAVFDTAAENSPPQRVAKRVWALPGEQIELREGEAWVNGQVLQKSIDELAEVCIPLSRFPEDSHSQWWIEDDSHSSLRVEANASSTQLALQPSQRLQFRYARPSRDPASLSLTPSPIVDDYPCNQNSIAELHRVEDYLVAIEFSEPSTAVWQMSLKRGQQTYSVPIEDSDKPPLTSQFLIVAICDGRLLVASENSDLQKTLADLPVATANNGNDAATDSEAPLITITPQQQLSIKRLIVARDLWLGPREIRSQNWLPEPATDTSGYFVLGDNLPLSIDSRDPRVGRIARNRITGRVNATQPSSSRKKWIERLFP